MKKHWSVPDGDNEAVVWLLAICMFIFWCLTLGAMPLEYKLQGDDNTYTIGGWWHKLFPKK